MSETTCSAAKKPGLVLEIAVILCCKLTAIFGLWYFFSARTSASSKRLKTSQQPFWNVRRNLTIQHNKSLRGSSNDFF